MNMRTFLAAAIGLWACGCTKIPFTHDMRAQYDLTPDHLARVQFYTSGEIVLERRVERYTGTPTGRRRLQLTQAEVIRKINIPEGTPGVAVGVMDDRLEISFEEGRSIFFGSTVRRREKLGGLYSLMANRWEDGRGELLYGEDLYRTLPGCGAVHLQVDVDDVQRTRVVRKTLAGRIAPAESAFEVPGEILRAEDESASEAPAEEPELIETAGDSPDGQEAQPEGPGDPRESLIAPESL